MIRQRLSCPLRPSVRPSRSELAELAAGVSGKTVLLVRPQEDGLEREHTSGVEPADGIPRGAFREHFRGMLCLNSCCSRCGRQGTL